MDEIKRTFRNVKIDLKKTARGIDGTDLKDRVGNVGDEVRKDLGNLGDARPAGPEPEAGHDDPTTTPRRPR